MSRFAIAAWLLAGVSFWAGSPATGAPASPATGAEEILRLVPESASAVVVFHRPAEIEAKIRALAQLVQFPLPGPVALLKQERGILTGVDVKGTMGIVVLPSPANSAPAPMIVLVPVTDYGAFLRQFKAEDSGPKPIKIEVGQVPVWVRSVGRYAALSLTRETLDGLKLSATVPGSLAPWREWLSGSDVAGVVLAPGIKEISARLQAGIAKVRSALPQSNEQTKMAAAVFGAYGQMFLDAEKQVSACGFGLQLDEHSALRVVGRIALARGRCDQLLAQVHPSRENLLKGLPVGPFVVAGGESASEATFVAMQECVFGFMKRLPDVYGLSEDRIAKLAEAASRSIKGMRGMSMVMAAGDGRGGQSIFSGIVSTIRVDNAATFLDRYQQYVHQYNEALKGAKSSMLQPLEIQKGTLAGAAALQVSISAPKTMPGMPSAQYDRAMEAAFGPGKKIVMWLAPVGPQSVVMSYMSKERLERVVEDMRRGTPDLAHDAEVAKTASLLPPDAFAVGYVSLQGAMTFVKRTLTALVPPGAEAPRLLQFPEFPQAPPLGFAVTAAPHELRTCLAVPPELLKAIGNYVKVVQGGASAARPQPQAKAPAAATKPLALDLTPFGQFKKYTWPAMQSYAGRQVIDGLPFEVRCQIYLYGETPASRGQAWLETVKGIRVGRTFDELHLIHHSVWPGVEGETVAYIELNYADGTKSILPIRYGRHILDWSYLPSYDQEAPTDPNTKVCWRHAPLQYKAPLRLFKSMLRNPVPAKVVETMDVVSARHLASYGLVAATVADRDAARPVTPPPPDKEPKRKFDGRLVIRVVDDEKGTPIAEAVIEPGMVVQDQGVVGQPLLTSSAGAGTIRYPIKQTSEISVRAKKEGYQPQWRQWHAGDIPDAFTLRLKRL